MATPQQNGTGRDLLANDERLRRANITIHGVAFHRKHSRRKITHCGELLANDLLKILESDAWARLETETEQWLNFRDKGKGLVLYAAADPTFHTTPIHSILGLRAALLRVAEAGGRTLYVEARPCDTPYNPNKLASNVLPTRWPADATRTTRRSASPASSSRGRRQSHGNPRSLSSSVGLFGHELSSGEESESDHDGLGVKIKAEAVEEHPQEGQESDYVDEV